MVLNRQLFAKTVPFLLALLMSACSHFTSQTQTNRSPQKPVIPAENNSTVFQDKPSNKSNLTINTSKTSHTQTSSEEPNIAVNLGRTTTTKPADVLSSILDSAKKAIQKQEWLRAQHHLEHALRIAPKDAEVFYLYAKVYEGLGVEKQAISMLKRASFLSMPESDIYQLAQEKLIKLSE